MDFFFFSRMVPTSVERLREGQGVLERVLRSIKMERIYKRSDGSTEKESGMKSLDQCSPKWVPCDLARQLDS